MVASEKIAVLEEFHEFRQEHGLYGALWDQQVAAFAAHVKQAEAEDIKAAIARALRDGSLGADEREGLVLSLVDQLA
jgi:hypothetical protein